jgi:hypothetical protein
MANDNFRTMMVALMPLDEPIRRKRPHKQPKQAKKWQRDRKAQRNYITSLNTHWNGEDDA